MLCPQKEHLCFKKYCGENTGHSLHPGFKHAEDFKNSERDMLVLHRKSQREVSAARGRNSTKNEHKKAKIAHSAMQAGLRNKT
jgi:hypothetical protein